MGKTSISTEPIKEKLRDYRQAHPNECEATYLLTELLENRLCDGTVSPEAYCDIGQIALTDLRKGYDSITGKQIKHDLVGLPGLIYVLKGVTLGDITTNVCPKDFAKKAKKRYEQCLKFSKKLDERCQN